MTMSRNITITMSMDEYEALKKFKDEYHVLSNDYNSLQRDLELYIERWKEAVKIVDEFSKENFELRQWKIEVEEKFNRWGERFDAD